MQGQNLSNFHQAGLLQKVLPGLASWLMGFGHALDCPSAGTPLWNPFSHILGTFCLLLPLSENPLSHLNTGFLYLFYRNWRKSNSLRSCLGQFFFHTGNDYLITETFPWFYFHTLPGPSTLLRQNFRHSDWFGNGLICYTRWTRIANKQPVSYF